MTAQSAPSTGLLKSRLSARTVNAHAHLLNPLWWAPGTLPNRTPTPERRLEPAMAMEEDDERKLEDRHARRRLMARDLDGQAAYFLEEMDEAGLDLMVNLTMDHSEFPGGGGRMYKVPFEEVLRECAALKEKWPGRFEMFCGVDPRRGAAKSVTMLERAVKEFGAIGLGEMISTQWSTMPNDRDLCYPLYEKAADMGIPLMQDATMARGYSVPDMLIEIARDFPTLQVCYGGAGAGVAPVERDGKSLPAHERLLELACEYPNVWLDIDDWQTRDQAGIDMAVDFVYRALSGPARDRIMFGSDYPVRQRMYTEEDWLKAFFAAADRTGREFSTEDLTLFFSSNALRFLGLDARPQA